MEATIQCRICGQTVRARTRVCAACGVRGPGTKIAAVFTAWSIVVFVGAAGGAVWLYSTGVSSSLGLTLVIAAAIAALLRVFLPMIVSAPQPRRDSLVSRAAALQSRVDEIDGQLAALAEAFNLARRRQKSRLIDVTKNRLKRTYSLLAGYRNRFEAQLVHLQFALWMQETAAIISGWELGNPAHLSAAYDRLVQRTDNFRVRFEELISGKKTRGVYARASAVIQNGLARVDAVGDAMVARKAHLALAAVSPASLPELFHYESIVEDLATDDLVHAADALEREYDRIVAEHDLSS